MLCLFQHCYIKSDMGALVNMPTHRSVFMSIAEPKVHPVDNFGKYCHEVNACKS